MEECTRKIKEKIEKVGPLRPAFSVLKQLLYKQVFCVLVLAEKVSHTAKGKLT